ncbi:hypothetical protein CMK11_20895, partial [Candidatus Poribacteria bacterium]|nr:hypothetical protein [Candidatus Poribacteria bacterium]
MARVLVAFTVVAGAAHAASVYRIEPADGGIAGMAAVAPEFVARSASVEDQGANGDGVASPGESLHVRLRLQNAGGDDAQNLTMALTTDDPDIDLPESVLVSPRWQAGLTTSVAWRVTIAATAAPHLVAATATFTADNGGPWAFIVAFRIEAAPVAFAKTDGWIDDPVPAGDGDGRAEPGERIRVGVRLLNEGATDGAGVRVALRALDTDVAPVVAEAIHTSWPAGEARDTVFLVDITPTAHTHDVPVVISVTVEGVDPWHFSVLIPVVAPAPEFELRSAWLFDPAPGGNRDGRAVPGERVLPRVRLRNVGSAQATNVAVRLMTADPHVAVVDGDADHATWPTGEARNSGLALDISPDAAPHDFAATVTVTADGGGPWEFALTFTIAPPEAAFTLESSWLFDPRPLGNRDGALSPGETAFPRVRLRNTGADDAFGAVVTLATDDPDVSVVDDRITYEGWPAGIGRNNTGFTVEVRNDAQPHDVTFTATVTTAHAGPWQFAVVLPIVYRAVEFAPRSSWVFDPQPGGDRDGQAEAGERVLPRLRLLHVGSEEARNVRVDLTTDDAEVTIVQGDLLYETWAP